MRLDREEEARMGNGKTGEAVEGFKRYAEVFARLDARAIVSFYNEPALLISPQGIVALSTGADVERFFGRLMADLRADGYAKSEFPLLAEHYLSSDLAVVSGVGVWRKANGEELRRFGLTYTLCRALPSWKIVVAVVHDPDAALHLT
jgi:ketosteroid isomerase-like protein